MVEVVRYINGLVEKEKHQREAAFDDRAQQRFPQVPVEHMKIALHAALFSACQTFVTSNPAAVLTHIRVPRGRLTYARGGKRSQPSWICPAS